MMTKYIRNEEHYSKVLKSLTDVKRELWIATSDIKDIYMRDGIPLLGKLAELLLKAGANPNAVDRYGETPLHTAAKLEWYDNVRSLLKGGASPDIQTCHGDTPLHYAAESNTPGLIDLLLKAGADANAVNRSGETPLYIAAKLGWHDNVMSLLNGGASPDIQNCHGDTPLDIANEWENPECVTILSEWLASR